MLDSMRLTNMLTNRLKNTLYAIIINILTKVVVDSMPFETGHKKMGGRRKGVANQTTAKVKEAILSAFEQVGGEAYLVKVANDDPKTFCALLARLLPTEMKAQISDSASESIVERLRRGRERAMQDEA